MSGRPRSVYPRLAPQIRVHAAESFDGPLREAITQFKDRGRRDVGPELGRLARRAVAAALTDSPASGDGLIVLVPVPSSPTSVRERGRRPLAELASHVRAGTGLIDGDRLLSHKGRVRDQSRLRLEERQENVTGVFVVPEQAGAWLRRHRPRLVLFDDVVTSGATLAAAHAALKQAGAVTIEPAVIAATPWKVNPSGT